jgi:PAS domain-containing protein
MKEIREHQAQSNRLKGNRLTADRLTATLPQINNLFDIPINFFELLDEIAIGLVIMDRERKIIGMNQVLKALTGFSQKELVGVHCAHILRSSLCLNRCPALHVDEKSGPKS